MLTEFLDACTFIVLDTVQLLQYTIIKSLAYGHGDMIDL